MKFVIYLLYFNIYTIIIFYTIIFSGLHIFTANYLVPTVTDTVPNVQFMETWPGPDLGEG